MTQREMAIKNQISKEMEIAAKNEELPVEFIREGLEKGNIALVKNKKHNLKKPLAVGKGLTVKINANIGTSPNCIDLELEKEKLKVCHEYGVDAVMDLSIGGNIDATRQMVLDYSEMAVGTVPLYQIAAEVLKSGRNLEDINLDDILSVIKRQAEQGVDFMTIHSGLTLKGVELARKRMLGIVSRGGAIIAEWMSKTGKESLLYTHYDEILDVLRDYDVTISLGDGLRPGCIEDATDQAQITELMKLGELTERAWKKGVQVMIEGPGHVPFDQVQANMQLEKRLCHDAPFYVLGPLVTDIAPGYDHIAGAIGGTLAAVSGADFLCYLTPAEHLRLPNIEDVKEGIIASKIAAHAADLVKGIPSAKKQDHQMAVARKNLDWESMFNLALDPEKARRYRSESNIGSDKECTMCGSFCSVKKMMDEI